MSYEDDMDWLKDDATMREDEHNEIQELRHALAAETARLDWLISQTEWTQEQRELGPRKVIDAARGAK
jgi:hypothetical protein